MHLSPLEGIAQMDAHRLRSVIDLIIAEHRRLEVYQQLTWIQQRP
jgi:hypothetical protein